MSKTILISPLDWGLGHATRIIPIIEYYLRSNHRVVIGGNGVSFSVLKKRFPALEFESIPGYEVTYSNKVGFAVKMLLSLPAIYSGIKKEEKRVAQLHKEYQFDLIISDNRYGVHLNGVKSFIVTHQLNIRFPYFENIIFKVQKKLLNTFDCCLVPDFPLKENLAGELSILKKGQQLKTSLKYVGALSRFYNSTIEQGTIKYQFIAVVSGPEPHRTELTNLLIQAFKESDQQLAILTYDYKLMTDFPSNVHLFLDCDDEQFLSLIAQSETLISRSGYTTLMDLIYLKKGAFFIPTPGQTEQLYLAEYAQKNGWANYCLQEDFSIDKVVTGSKEGKGFPFGKSPLNVVLGGLEE